MSDFVTVTVLGDKQTIARLRATPAAVMDALRKATATSAFALEARVKRKLSGDVLKVRSGNLRSSVNTQITEGTNSIRASVGTGVKYAAIHEYGGTIKHPGGTAYFVGVGNLAVFVANRNPLSNKLPRTKPHDIPMPERSFLRSSLREEKDAIRDRYKRELVKVLKTGKAA